MRIFACLLMFGVAGCSLFIRPDEEVLNVTSHAVVGVWSLASVDGVAVRQGAGTLAFGHDGKMSGKIGCTTINGNYVVPPKQILFRHVAYGTSPCAVAGDAQLGAIIPSFMPFTDAYTSLDHQGLTIAGRRELRFRRVR